MRTNIALAAVIIGVTLAFVDDRPIRPLGNALLMVTILFVEHLITSQKNRVADRKVMTLLVQFFGVVFGGVALVAAFALMDPTVPVMDYLRRFYNFAIFSYISGCLFQAADHSVWTRKWLLQTGNGVFWVTFLFLLSAFAGVFWQFYYPQNQLPMVSFLIGGGWFAHLFSTVGIRLNHKGGQPVLWLIYVLAACAINTVFAVTYALNEPVASVFTMTAGHMAAYAIALAIPWSASIARLPTQLKQNS